MGEIVDEIGQKKVANMNRISRLISRENRETEVRRKFSRTRSMQEIDTLPPASFHFPFVVEFSKKKRGKKSHVSQRSSIFHGWSASRVYKSSSVHVLDHLITGEKFIYYYESSYQQIYTHATVEQCVN